MRASQDGLNGIHADEHFLTSLELGLSHRASTQFPCMLHFYRNYKQDTWDCKPIIMMCDTL